MIATLPIEEVPGVNLAAKLKRACNEDGIEEMAKLFMDRGSVFKHDKPGSIAIVPAGHFVVMFATARTDGIRWGRLNPSDKMQTKIVFDAMDQLLSAFPALESAPKYSKWHKILQTRLANS